MTFDPSRPPDHVPPPTVRMEAFSPVAPEPFDPSTLEVPVAPVRSTAGSGRVLNLALGVAVLVAATGVAFALGRASAPAAVAAPLAPAANVPGGAGGPASGGVPANGGGTGNLPGASFDLNGGGPNGGGPGGGDDTDGGLGLERGGGSVQGTVQSVTADGVTLKLANGRTITIGLDGSTTYHAEASAAPSDVAAGKQVIVRVTGGFRPSDGSANGSGGVRFGTAADVTVLP